jgi:hypothetical protein
MTLNDFTKDLPGNEQKPLRKNGSQIFVAYPFSLYEDREAEYRAIFNRVGRPFNVNFMFADERISNLHILDKIQELIQSSRFAIFDISGWNPNVTLEIGLARGIGHPTFIVIDPSQTPKGQIVPSDLGGFDRIQYRSFQELEGKLVNLLKCQLPSPKLFKLEDQYWNPHGLPKASPLEYAVALRDINVTMNQDLDDPMMMFVMVTYRLESRNLRSIGSEHAPWLHLVLLDKNKNSLVVEEAKHWEELEFRPHENRFVKKQKKIRCFQFYEIADVHFQFSRGYEGSDFPSDGQPRVSIPARIRHLWGKWRRSLRHGRS